MLVGDPFAVRGSSEPIDFDRNGVSSQIWPTSVTVRLDGVTQPVTRLDTRWQTWEAALTVRTAGPHTITASAQFPSNPNNENFREGTVSVQGLAVAALAEPMGPVVTREFALAVQGATGSGLTGARARLDSQSWVTLAPAGPDRFRGDVSLASFEVPGAGRAVPVQFEVTRSNGSTDDGEALITALDATTPAIESFEPSDGAKISGTAVGGPTTVLVTVRDSDGHQLTSGTETVEVRLDQGAWRACEPAGGTEPSRWRATVFVPGADDHTLTVRARDGAGRQSAEITHRVVVTAPADLRDLSRQTYLADLIAFASRRLLARPAASGPTPHVTAAQLGEAVGQDLVATARMAPADANAPTRTLRLVVEALIRYMRPGPPAPLAAWPLHDGNGDRALDEASGLATGAVANATWTSGDTPALLHFDPAAAAHVQVAAEGAAQVRARDGLTVVARIRPSADTPDAAIVVNKEGEYELARFPDGTVRWALATDTPGWQWIDTGAVAPVGEWTHVVIAYDGVRVRTWTDGVLRNTVGATGAIGDVAPAQNELWIGGRPVFGQYFAGEIADVAVYDRGLTEYDVHRLLGRSDDDDGNEPWVDDDVPLGAQTSVDNDAWDWVAADPTPSSGARCHRSRAAAGEHLHQFTVTDTAFPVDRGDVLVTDVWLDPANPPRELLLQWQDADGSWEHRAYWGEDLIAWGDSTVAPQSRRRIGDLPEAGTWTRLRVAAADIGLEQMTIHGVGYAVFDGRAAWDRTGRLTAPAAAARSAHLEAAYAALLRSHGTSEVELRLARGASAAERAALATRLGFTLAAARPDELDVLLLDQDELDAAALERIFGFLSPLAAPHVIPAPLLTQWRLAALRARWRATDAGSASSTAQPPVLDPEIVVPEDVVGAQSDAAALLRDRIAWRQAQLAALRALRSGAPDDAAAVTAALGVALAGVDLDELAAARRAGQDISTPLTAAGLTLPGLRRILQLRDLARTGPLRDVEWEDLVTELVHVLRRLNWPSWRLAETAADVLLDPAVFRDSALAEAAAFPDYIDPAARADWIDRLAARALSVGSIRAAETAALAAADDAALPRLRDALVATVDPNVANLSAADALTSTLLIDVGAGAQDVTSRAEQAIATVQGIIFAARTNRLRPQGAWPPPGPAARWRLEETDAYPRADFDEEWRWMGTLAAWQAAVSVFFRPELLLYPTLRSSPSAPFLGLVDALADAGSDLTPQAARAQADRFRQTLSVATTAALQPIQDLILSDQLAPAQIADLAAGQSRPPGDPQGRPPGVLAAFDDLDEIPRELLEALWLVPLQLAVALSRAGQHVAAVDWLRTLYAYDQAGDERIVFHGFRLEATGTAQLSRPERWLLGDELNPHRIADGRPGAHLRFALLLLARCLLEQADSEFTADTPESRPRARDLYLAAIRSLREPGFEDSRDAPPLPANPLLSLLRGRATANLGKLRRGLTIAGVPRPAPAAYEAADTQLVVTTDGTGPLAPPATAPQPTPYRYATLIARAQQLLGVATQVENSYIAALAGADRENYTEQRAADDLELATASKIVRQGAAEAADEEAKVAQAQAARAKRQADTLDGWVAAGESSWEQALLESYQEVSTLRTLVAAADAAVTTAGLWAGVNSAGGAAAAAAGTVAAGLRAAGASVLGQTESRQQEAATRATYERRSQEWQLQAALARDDEAIATQQGEVMRRRAALAAQERDIGVTQERHAQATVDFLAGRRLTGEMYAWIAGELGEVYRYLLRQATSIAQLAEQQLAFERQQPPPGVIKANYWTPTGVQNQDGPDRRGLTGSARLLRDLTELDQHAFETNRRKLNLEHVFPLSRVAPEAFAEFRRTGVLPFATPMDAFDRRFPGHFLRTIRRVRLSFVALIPPLQGVAATLTCSGQSRVVVGQYGLLRPITLTRPPETVAYTSSGTSGVFELDPQPELKAFFEDHGVDTTWLLRLPKPANPIDFSAIAEIVVTVEYTALADEDYARQVRASLPRRTHGTLALSLRDDFPDAWYALVEGDSVRPDVIPPVSLNLTRADFPRNVEDVRLDAITVLVVRAGERVQDAPDLRADHLHLVRGERRIRGGSATAVDDVISTRLGSGSGWSPLLDPPPLVADSTGAPAPWDPTPTGDWELAFASDADTRETLRSGAIADVVLVMSYRADLPAWPA